MATSGRRLRDFGTTSVRPAAKESASIAGRAAVIPFAHDAFLGAIGDAVDSSVAGTVAGHDHVRQARYVPARARSGRRGGRRGRDGCRSPVDDLLRCVRQGGRREESPDDRRQHFSYRVDDQAGDVARRDDARRARRASTRRSNCEIPARVLARPGVDLMARGGTPPTTPARRAARSRFAICSRRRPGSPIRSWTRGSRSWTMGTIRGSFRW